MTVDCIALVDLTSSLLPPMARRGRGIVINIASTAAFQPVPSMAAYGASKAFVLSDSEALAAEAADSNITVLAVCPGTTRSECSELVGAEEVLVGHEVTAESVVDIAMAALPRARPASSPAGPMNCRPGFPTGSCHATCRRRSFAKDAATDLIRRRTVSASRVVRRVVFERVQCDRAPAISRVIVRNLSMSCGEWQCIGEIRTAPSNPNESSMRFEYRLEATRS